MPSTDSTPRIAPSWLGTGISDLAVVGLAEELVDQLLDLGQRGAQFLHHAAHGLAVGDAAVQLLHPAFERLGRLALAHRAEPVGQAAHALGLFGVVEVGILERGLDVEQAGRDFHRQRRGRRRAGGWVCATAMLQFGGEGLAEREQALERIADERELLGQAGQPVHFAAGHRRTRTPWPRTTRLRACTISAGSKRPSTLTV